MTTTLYDLQDRVITDMGTVVPKHAMLVACALRGDDITALPYVDHPDVNRYHEFNKTKVARRWRDDGVYRGPVPKTFEWKTPEPFASMDIRDAAYQALVDRGLENETSYVERVNDELDLMEERGFEPFFRAILWVVDVFRRNETVWGIGRGSSCACLLMYILGVNAVDPVKYDIDMREFYK